MNEFEVYLKEAAKYVAEFLNNERNYDDTIKTMKVTFALDDAQEAALRIVLTELDYMAERIDNEERAPFVGLNCNIIAAILLKGWGTLNQKTLK